VATFVGHSSRDCPPNLPFSFHSPSFSRPCRELTAKPTLCLARVSSEESQKRYTTSEKARRSQGCFLSTQRTLFSRSLSVSLSPHQKKKKGSTASMERPGKDLYLGNEPLILPNPSSMERRKDLSDASGYRTLPSPLFSPLNRKKEQVKEYPFL